MKDKLKMVIPEDIIRRIIDSDVTFEKYFDIKKEKERNIMINLTKYLIKNNKCVDYEFSYDEIRSHILIKDIDYIVYKEKLFDIDKFKLNKEVIGMIKKYIDTHFFNLNCDKENDFKKEFIELNNSLCVNIYNEDKVKSHIKNCANLAKELHWKYLPILNVELMKYRSCLPEELTFYYYKNFHTIQSLYKEIVGKGIEFHTVSDKHIVGQNMDFKVYSTRWNSYDTYIIRKTNYGWEIIDNNLKAFHSLKNGVGGLFDILNNDKIYFPKEWIMEALEKLWDLADNGMIDLEELKNRINSLAIWISDIERNIRIKQPKWFKY